MHVCVICSNESDDCLPNIYLQNSESLSKILLSFLKDLNTIEELYNYFVV